MNAAPSLPLTTPLRGDQPQPLLHLTNQHLPLQQIHPPLPHTPHLPIGQTITQPITSPPLLFARFKALGDVERAGYEADAVGLGGEEGVDSGWN